MEKNSASRLNITFDNVLVKRSPLLKKNGGHQVNILQFFNENEIFKEAIYLASRDFYFEVVRHLENNLKPTQKLLNSLYKYYIRMQTRCTPFGLFSTISTGNHSRESVGIQRNVRLDTVCISQIINYMNSLDVLKKRVLFHKNNSVYNSLGVIKYINYSNPNNNYKKFSLLSVKSNSVIQEIISQCSNEGRSINYLVDFLVNLGYEKDEAIDFIHNLIQEGFIISEFQIKLTSKEEQLNYIIEFLKSKFLDRDLPEIISKLSEIREIILRIENTNNQGHINYIELYEDVRKCLIELTFIDVPKNFIQIDTYIPENILDWGQLKSIQNVIFFLTTVGHNVSGNLYNFKNKFFEKYGNRTISLSTVMDPDIGLESKYQPLRPSLSNMLNRKVNTTLTLSDKDTFWLKKIVNALATRSDIEISDTDLRRFPDRAINLPASFSLIFSHKIENGSSKYLLKGFNGKSAANVVGRFVHCDSSIEKLIERICDHEEDYHSGKKVAEVVHFPGMDRLGNVMLRQHSRQLELPYVAVGNSDISNLKFDDLFLRFRNDEIELLSAQHKKALIPYHSCAHNYNFDSLPVYKLLCDLNNQGNTFNFDFGSNTQFFKYLPRVTYKDIILSPRCWKIDLGEIADDKLIDVLKSENVPNKFIISEGDNELFIDLENDSLFALLKEFHSKSKSITIKEYFFDGDESDINEYVATGYSKNLKDPKPVSNKKKKNIQKNHIPGGDWLYLKIYLNSDLANMVLKKHIYPTLSRIAKIVDVKKCFFIRYSDPNFHLRLRILSNDNNLVQSEFSKMFSYLINKEIISTLSIDTYERELERYGYENMEETESLFHLHSNFIIKILSTPHEEQELYLICITFIQDLLDLFNFTLTEKLQFSNMFRDSFQRELEFHKTGKIFLDRLYKEYIRPNIIDIGKVLSNKTISYLSGIRKGTRISFIEQNLKKDNLSKQEYCSSIIHMFVNRIFETNNRTHEFIIYYLYSKFIKDYKYLVR